jgi:hypothetical protein
MIDQEKQLFWIGSSKKDLMALPLTVRKFFGHALDFAQRGDQHDAAKVLKGFGGAGVLEIVENDSGGTYISSGLHGEVRRSRICPSLLSKEKQARDCNAERRY